MTIIYSLFLYQKPALRRVILPCGLLCIGLFLSGCQSEKERKIAEAKARAQLQVEIQQNSPTAPAATSPATGPAAPSAAGAPSARAAGTSPPLKISLDLPIYPGA